jgi:serine/threonine protein kinase
MTPIKKIGKYDILETIGRGGMGVVLKATDPVLGRLVAIKMMTDGFSDDPDLLKRFYREAQSTARLTHPNIVTVYDMGDQDGIPYLVMQYLEGESLHAMIKSRRNLSLLTKANYLLQICHGLQYAHEQQITHRDIKPANIMVLPDGTVKIVDFGIARMANDQLTRPGQVMGSIYYMSPEQINEGEVDSRSDIFALGALAYELLTFALPFRGQDPSSTLLKILRDPPPPPKVHLQEYNAGFDAILERAMAKSKQDRYQTVDEMALDVARVEQQLRKEMIATVRARAEKLISEGDLASARAQLQQLIKLDPHDGSACKSMQDVQLELQKQGHSANARQSSPAPREHPSPVEHRPQQLRDRGVLELTPPLGVLPAAPPPEVVSSNASSSDVDAANFDTYTFTSPPPAPDGGTTVMPAPILRTDSASANTSVWQDESLRTVEKQLASFVGSLAKILVKKAASRTTDVEELYSILSASLESEADREAFLARKVDLYKGSAKVLSPREPLQSGLTAPLNPGSLDELTPAAITHAAQLLARHVGPLAGVLAKRAAPRADSLRALYLLLAEHVENKKERSRFLRDGGFPES